MEKNIKICCACSKTFYFSNHSCYVDEKNYYYCEHCTNKKTNKWKGEIKPKIIKYCKKKFKKNELKLYELSYIDRSLDLLKFMPEKLIETYIKETWKNNRWN